MFITGVNGTGNKLFTGVNDTRDKFSVIPGVVDTASKFLSGVNRWTIIVDDNDISDKFIASDKNKDAMEVGSCQG